MYQFYTSSVLLWCFLVAFFFSEFYLLKYNILENNLLNNDKQKSISK